MQSTVTILDAAQDISLLTTYEARFGLNLASSSDETIDDLLAMLIRWSSDEIALMCNRTFAKERMKEVARNIDSTICKKLYLSHFPIVGIESVDLAGTALTEGVDYEVDTEGGWIP